MPPQREGTLTPGAIPSALDLDFDTKRRSICANVLKAHVLPATRPNGHSVALAGRRVPGSRSPLTGRRSRLPVGKHGGLR